MPLRFFDFRCANGHVHEHMVDAGERTVECPSCGQPAQRMIAAPRCQLEGITGAFPGAAMAWERKREQKMAQERKHKEKHGTWR